MVQVKGIQAALCCLSLGISERFWTHGFEPILKDNIINTIQSASLINNCHLHKNITTSEQSVFWDLMIEKQDEGVN